MRDGKQKTKSIDIYFKILVQCRDAHSNSKSFHDIVECEVTEANLSMLEDRW